MGALRRLTADDIPRVLEIQAAAYAPQLLETAEVFAAKIDAHPPYCIGWAGDDGGLAAYVIAFPMSSTASVGLHESEARTAQGGVQAGILYIHDMAVHPAVHGTGAGRNLLGALESLGRRNGQSVIELVAIETAVTFWEGHGFVARGDDVHEGYGPGALKMARSL